MIPGQSREKRFLTSFSLFGNYSFPSLVACLFLAFCLEACAPKLLAIEVTQGLQAISHSNRQDPLSNNTIPLVKGRKTLVRAYLSLGGYLRAHLSVAGVSSGPSIILMSNNTEPISGGLVREDITASFNFELPDWLIDSEEITIGPLKLVSTGNQPLPCSNCANYPLITLPMFESTPLRVRLIGVSYSNTFGNYPVGELHYKMIRSWLKRTLPIDEVVSPFQLPSTQEDGISYNSDPDGALFDDTDRDGKLLETCGRVNGQIFDIRKTDIDTHEANFPLWLILNRTRYVGLLSDLGFYRVNEAGDQVPILFPRGCTSGLASNPSIPATTPVGVGRTGFYPWDTDGSYGDWSTSHELGHTFGLKHPTKPDPCGAEEGGTYDSPYDGMVSPSYPNDPVYAGLDFGDWISLTTGNGVLLPMKAIPGSWYDSMSYCPDKWIGPDSYNGIRSALLSLEYPIYGLSGDLFSDSSTPSTIYMYENRRPPPLPYRVVREVLIECLRGGLDNPRGTPECLRKEGGSGVTVILPNSKNLPSSSSPSGMAVSPEILEGSHLPGIFDKESSNHVLSIEKGRFIRVAASVDLSEGKGRITYARRITLALSQSQPTDNRILLRVTDRKGKVVEQPMVFYQHSDTFSQKRQRGIATTILRFEEEVAKIELLLPENQLPADEIAVSDQPLPPLIIDPLNVSMTDESEKNSLSITWNLNPDSPPIIGQKITYTVQISYDKGVSWQTIAINLKQNRFELPAYRLQDFDNVEIKVIANDRFQTSEGKLIVVSTKSKP